MKAMSAQLIRQSYFDEIQKEMVRIGFALISKVAIDSSELRYHVPTLLARVTSLFFHTHGKSFMIMLRYYEQIRDETSPCEGYWSATLYMRFKPYKELLDDNPEWLGKSMEESLYHDMPVFGSTELEFEGFRLHTGTCMHHDTENEQVGLCYEQNGGHRAGTLAAHVLARRVCKAFEIVERYLDCAPFYRISLLDFLPHYVFSENGHNGFDLERLEEIFWPRFDWNYFKHLVVRPYGYNYRGKRDRVAA